MLNPMTRIWRSTALLLLAFMALDMAVLIYMATAGARLNAGTYLSGQQFAWTVLDAFLVWRVWRGERWAWTVLLVISIVVLAELVLGLHWSWSAYAAGLWVFDIAQLLILLAPAVRHHVRQGQQYSGV